MENGGGNSSLAQPGASRSGKRCASPIFSALGKTGRRISQIEGPLPKLRVVSYDDEVAGKAPDKNEPRSISMVAPGGLRFDSQDSTNGGLTDESPEESNISTIPTDAKPGGLRFAGESAPSSGPLSMYQERNSSSLESDETSDIPATGSCNRPQVRSQSRNTMGLKSYTKSVGRCGEDQECTEECGYGTGCEPKCREIHGIPPDSLASSLTVPSLSLTGTGGPSAYPGAYSGAYAGAYSSLTAGPGGYPVQGGYPDSYGGLYSAEMECSDDCSGPMENSSPLNFYIMLLLEVFGVLIFFAICTITFWITLAYHFVKLLIELKNADRNTQVAVAIAFGLLFLAFAICHLTSGRSSCSRSPCVRSSCGRSSGGRPSGKSHRHFWNKSGSCSSCNPEPDPEPKTSTTVKILSQIKRLLSFGCGKCNKARVKSTPCSGIKCAPAKTKKQVAQCRKKPKYSDCEGRAIFINSRRYAIPTEMKQPPTILVWLLDILGRYM